MSAETALIKWSEVFFYCLLILQIFVGCWGYEYIRIFIHQRKIHLLHTELPHHRTLDISFTKFPHTRDTESLNRCGYLHPYFFHQDISGYGPLQSSDQSSGGLSLIITLKRSITCNLLLSKFTPEGHQNSVSWRWGEVILVIWDDVKSYLSCGTFLARVLEVNLLLCDYLCIS